ncbi:MAG: HD domain-containing protein [Spirochaetia bacterium]|nr:HD domain-containing protein [Spirochaetia bacterium]MDY3722627.1 HD domain-containing phosphohydrolase [Treponema sp.]MDY5818367.1 HD domain-containing phosphohydrolase [Treponema sp.]
MNDNTELFFNENIRSVNKVVEILLLTCAVVPLAFCVLTLLGIWRVPHDYSALMFSYSVFSFFVAHGLNRFPKTQKIGMYFGIIAAAGFVELLAVKNIIQVNITYAVVPFLSCLYFNKKVTITSTITGFALMVFALFVRSKTVLTVMATDVQVHNPHTWFISTLVGYSIEFLFIFLLALTMANRSHKAIELLHTQNVNLKNTQDMIIEFVASCLGSHDLFTGRHVQHTKHYVKIIATKLRDFGYYTDVLTDETIHLYETAAFLHDIGKIHIPEGVLNKIGKFTEEDYKVMKTHSVEGKRLLEQLPKVGDGRFNQIAIDMAFTHHEKWDGTGYPRGLKGKEIPLSGRIMAAADVMDALISKRLYKEQFTINEAIKIFNESTEKQFEPCIVEATKACQEEIEELAKTFKKQEAESEKEEVEWWENYHNSMKKI